MSLHQSGDNTAERRPPYQRQTTLERRQQNISAFRLSDSLTVAQSDDGDFEYCVALHDGTWTVNSEIKPLGTARSVRGSSDDSSRTGSGVSTPLSMADASEALVTAFIDYLSIYRETHLSKPTGAGITAHLNHLSPHLAVRLWQELDVVPFIFPIDSNEKDNQTSMPLDQQAEYMSRKTAKRFNVKGELPVRMGHRREVLVDLDGCVKITERDSYNNTAKSETTGAATMHYADSLKKKKTKICFFNRYVPYGKNEVFRITKDNHNILQGVASEGERLNPEKVAILDSWVLEEAEKCHWAEFGGPLSAREKGGADVIVVDDPQMPSLVKIAKEKDPSRPVIFRSHIQVRADLADQEGTATSEVWNWIWNHVKDCDVFVSHPVRAFVPKNVTPEKVGYLPATTDWLDGLNKHMHNWDEQYYIHEFRVQCFAAGACQLMLPDRPYIVQIARFDPAKGIPDVLASYARLRKTYMKETPLSNIPQLVIAGHGAVDDPDATRIHKETKAAIAADYKEFKEDIVVLRIGPSDQILNTLMSCAHVALQLSTREGFEVKVSEALHKGTPIIATRAGGIPLQVEHGKSGFLVKPGDHDAVAKHLYDLFTDFELHSTMSEYASRHVSDEVGTVGNALAWLYLADELAKGEHVVPNGQWINDMAREKAGIPYQKGEDRLVRDVDMTGN
ncbi:glycosyltransferase family 4 protein [Stemphylium lycopersici]|uniref:Glycosyltransferase family 4 protein n=1 Tax=Stemphylium lycopersici TaxID=183478 RepID=A0A364N417_STELY|nr:glycosyltransferase family 4 protein [Stemphylium lycopersici]RAR11433.1 glycosyltransferase family 4 protein [Stemphylium lycopersici]